MTSLGYSQCSSQYREALAAERKVYADCLEVHELPSAFHYWSNRHLLPKLLPHGFASPDGMFLKVLREQCERNSGRRFISIGAGNADLELKCAAALAGLGYRDFVIECLDLNEDMLERGRCAAQAAGLADCLAFVQGDFNQWRATGTYDAVIANQSLHHVVNLEGLCAQIRDALRPAGAFAISDMIGRNGHQRWPEALRIVREFWRKLPPSYRFNQKLSSYEEVFADWDCSGEGFEGVRSQDVLPLLREYFDFQLFIPFGNVIDPFIDRAFGGHFDVTSHWDREFLDQVHERDERELAAGRLTPTHLLAVVSAGSRGPLIPSDLIRRAIRIPDAVGEDADREEAKYAWSAWPHSAQSELEIACRRLAESENGDLLRERTAWARRLESELNQVKAQASLWRGELEQRTEWAQGLERDVVERTAWAEDLERQLNERTAWAQSLAVEAEFRATHVTQLETELAARTSWALQLEAELSERTDWAQRLQQEVAQKRELIERLQEALRRPILHWARAFCRRFFRGKK